MKGIHLLITVLILEVIAQHDKICKEIVEQWTISNCNNSMDKNGKCYFHDSHTIKVGFLSSTIFINCGSNMPEVNIIRCLHYAKDAAILYMEDCLFHPFNVKDLIFDTGISKIYLNFTGNTMVSSSINVTFSDLTNLRNITIEGAKTTSQFDVVLEIKFYALPNLFSLNIINSNLTDFNPESFAHLSSLQELCLRNGLIQYIPYTLLAALSNLRVLDLRFNHIKKIEWNTFLKQSHLRELYLSHNNLSVINKKAFQPLENLYELDISFNHINQLQGNMPFGQSKHLSVIKMTDCNLKELPKINWSHHSLTLLNFSNNMIEEVNVIIFTDKNMEVVLTNNSIKTITIDLKGWHSASPSYYIKSNHLSCDCKLVKFLQFLQSNVQQSRRVFFDAELETCKTPYLIPIMHIWPENIVCPIADCPTACNCLQKNDGYIHVECIGKGLLHPPPVIPFGTTSINLQSNNISSLSAIDSYVWQKVSQLNLSDNSLKSLEDSFLPINVRTLDVRNNFLTGIPFFLKEIIATTDNYAIFLENNKWTCQCESIEFIMWFINNSDKIIDFNQTCCITEGIHKEKLLIYHLDIHTLCVGMMAAPIVVILMFVVTLTILSLIAASCYYRNNIWPILYYLQFKICALCFTKRKHYEERFDVFLVYHQVDRIYANAVIHRLQVHKRFLTKEYNLSTEQAPEFSVLSSFSKSKKTVILVSKTLMECTRFKADFFQTYHDLLEAKLHKIIIIIIGKVSDIIDLECGYHIFCLGKIFLEWKERCFWMKLYYYLRPVPENDVFTEIPL